MSKQGDFQNFVLQQFKKLEEGCNTKETGWVTSITREGIITVFGLDQIKHNEIVEFHNIELKGLVWKFDKNFVTVIALGDIKSIKKNHIVQRTHKVLSVPTGDHLLGRVVNALGNAVDGMEEIKKINERAVENSAPSIMSRKSIYRGLNTGIKAIDAMIPIGLGQRELILGDRQTGKTAIAIDTILNQKGKDVICIYVAIGQRQSDISRIVHKLEDEGAMSYTTVVAVTAADMAIFKYLAPYTGCTIGEHFMYEGKDVLVVYDDLSKQAVAYREISLLLKRSPGREAYPGDIFYIHAKLLERSGQLNEKMGGGSLTVIPIIETQARDISSYIPTNVISITDGQIFLDSELFYQGHRPAINIGLSVSRVGSAAQSSIMKKVSGKAKLELSQFNELKEFTQIASDIDESAQKVLNRGKKLKEITKQKQFRTYAEAETILLFHVAYNLNPFAPDKFITYVKKKHPDLLNKLGNLNKIDEELQKEIQVALQQFNQ